MEDAAIIRRMAQIDSTVPAAPIQVIFLNGASSSGKTTLSRALQRRLTLPYIYLAEDMFFGAFPPHAYPPDEAYRYGWRLYNGFTQCTRTLVDCENLLIVDTAAWVPGSLPGFVNALWDKRVFAVGVHCPLEILEAREQQRGDRGVGMARRQFEAVHQNALYDFELDTSLADADTCAERVIQSMQEMQVPDAFARMKQLQVATSA